MATWFHYYCYAAIYLVLEPILWLSFLPFKVQLQIMDDLE